jgi:hypothetical protein
MKSAFLSSLLAAALLLIGCASDSEPARAPLPPPEPSTVGGAPPAPQPRGDGPDSGADQEPDDQPLAVGWRKEGVTRAQKAADIEACYQTAWGQVDKDIRIDDDIAAARDQVNSYQTRLGDLPQRVDSHYYSKQRITRFEGCMRTRGYSR